jgi:23S rRNA (cytosine1962-C5)-methyltransferase
VTTASIILKSGRERSVRQHHPWIFSGAIDRLEGSPAAGDTVDILDPTGKWLARAGYSPHSQIAARIWTWNPAEEVGKEFLQSAVRRSFEARNPLMEDTNAVRRIHAENDGLPGLIVDQYDDVLVLQSLTAAVEKWKTEIVEILSGYHGISTVYERSDADIRTKEGLDPQAGVFRGKEPSERVRIREGTWTFRVDVCRGHKTGFYLDQRDSRQLLARIIPQYVEGGEVLNCFSYTGAFAVAAIKAGAASVLNVDSSSPALAEVAEHMRVNGLSEEQGPVRCGNVFEVLREFRDTDRFFDMVILDPPKLMQSRKDLMRASRGYKDLNWLAARILKPGGILMTFSCSGLMSEDLFQKIVFSAFLDAGKDAQILHRCQQPADHPVRLTFPEGRYLTGLVCRVL